MALGVLILLISNHGSLVDCDPDACDCGHQMLDRVISLTEKYLDCRGCQKSPGLCPSDFTWFQNHCYKVFDTALTWMEAKEYCKELNADLASIENAQTQYFIRDELSKGSYKQTRFWIGGSDTEKGGTFVWTNRQGMTRPVSGYTSWNSGQPNNFDNEDCIVMASANGWNWFDDKCVELNLVSVAGDPKLFLCKRL